jgi:hypothetical protein
MMQKIICLLVYNVKLGVLEERAENLIFVFGLKYRAARFEELVASTFRAENSGHILKNASTVHPRICCPIL